MRWVGWGTVELQLALRDAVDEHLGIAPTRAGSHLHVEAAAGKREAEIGAGVCFTRADIPAVVPIGRSRILDLVPAARSAYRRIVAIEERGRILAADYERNTATCVVALDIRAGDAPDDR